mmetsp:Transcript_35095/g.56188  ORF Transcript_35095/g.56188 Transcript_35095/m.56188 type:complete len:694 (+) Transcript_35095:453-2534(+)
MDPVVPANSVRIYVVRHAEHVTPSMTHLSRKGSLQAVAIAHTLKRKRKVVAVYTSPRSYETAQNISQELGLGLMVDKRLLPWHGGCLTGLSRKQVQQKMPEVYQKRFVDRNPDYKVPDGESLNDRFQRVKEFLEEVVRRHMGEQIVLVTHGGIIDDLFRNAHHLPPTQLTGLKKPYGSLSVLVFQNEHFHEEVWGGVGHLPQAVAESPSGGQLYLFPHQVAGSFPMLRGDLGELCKPATENEMVTYEVFAKECPQVAIFAPAYMGKVVIDVEHIINNKKSLSGPLEFMHTPVEEDESMIPDENNGDSSMDALGKRQRGDSTMHINSNSQRLDQMSGPGQKKRQKFLGSGEEESAMTDAVSLGSADDGMMQVDQNATTLANNAHLQRVDQREWSVDTLWGRFIESRKHKAVEVGRGKFVYLIMENLTHGLTRPFIMDLKMGTQQHGSFESAEKKASKQRRVENTTSKTLGARIGGMQVYDEKEHAYVLRDKYWGRNLDNAGMYNALRDFVTEQSTGHVRQVVVKDIISQLDMLEEAVKSTYWRFYGCSVLIVYDSFNPNQNRERMNSATSEKSDESSHSNPELSCGQSKLVHSQDAGTQQHDQFNSTTPPLRFPRNITKHRSRSHSFDHPLNIIKSFSVAVRLIDFAKCERYADGATYDTGLVFGIVNLRKMFSRILLESPSVSIKRSLSANCL